MKFGNTAPVECCTLNENKSEVETVQLKCNENYSLLQHYRIKESTRSDVATSHLVVCNRWQPCSGAVVYFELGM